MATFNFETITPAQAAAFNPNNDLLIFGSGISAASVIVAFGSTSTSLTAGGRTVVLGTTPNSTVPLTADDFRFQDNSQLVLGTSAGEALVAPTTGSAVYGNAGGDTITVNAAVTGGVLLQGNQGADNITGGAGNDTIYGGADSDVNLAGGAGNDFISGDLGDDTISGGAGNDTLLGGDGEDDIEGGAGDDSINGGTSDDFLDGGAGNDFIQGGQGNDTIFGDGGADTLFGDRGDDTISGGTGADTISGGDGDDELSGNADDDSVNGNAGDDFIDGGAGNDLLQGGSGNDTIVGGSGNDTISGDLGIDVLVGGAGNDRFVFNAGTSTIADRGDVVLGFSSAAAGDNDTVTFGSGAGNGLNYREIALTGAETSYNDAVSFANDVMNGSVRYVLVSGATGVDFDGSGTAVPGETGQLLFADINGDGSADSVIRLSGITAAQFDFTDIA